MKRLRAFISKQLKPWLRLDNARKSSGGPFPRAAPQFANGQLDFVLVDAKHQYEDGGRQFVRAAFSLDTIISMAKSSKAISE